MQLSWTIEEIEALVAQATEQFSVVAPGMPSSLSIGEGARTMSIPMTSVTPEQQAKFSSRLTQRLKHMAGVLPDAMKDYQWNPNAAPRIKEALETYVLDQAKHIPAENGMESELASVMTPAAFEKHIGGILPEKRRETVFKQTSINQLEVDETGNMRMSSDVVPENRVQKVEEVATGKKGGKSGSHTSKLLTRNKAEMALMGLVTLLSGWGAWKTAQHIRKTDENGETHTDMGMLGWTAAQTLMAGLTGYLMLNPGNAPGMMHGGGR